METLAIIAYKQPITKSEIESIRGVNCDYAVQKLLEKDLVVIAGRNEEAVGKPLIYTTSKSFMDYFGINSKEDLPKINEVLMEELVQSTIIDHNQADFDLAGASTLEVGEDGAIIENLEVLQIEEVDALSISGDDGVIDQIASSMEAEEDSNNEDDKQVKDDEEATES